jgi:hypothetical protein
VLIVVFSVFTLVFSYIVYRICSEANSELLTSKIKFLSDGYSQVDQLKGAYKSSSFKVEKKDLAMFFQDVYKSVEKIDKKTKLVSYLSTLNTDLNINKDEAIEIKVESAISARISKKKDFSMLRNNNGISITNRGGFLPEAKTTMRILGSEKNITGDYFNKKELKKRETSKQILLAAVDDKHEEEEEIHLNNKTSKVDHNAYFNVVVDNKQKEKSDSNKNVAIKDSNSLKGKKDTKNNSNKDAIFIGNVDNKGFKENNSQTKLYNNNITNIYGVTQDNSHNNLVSTNSNHEIEGLTYLRDRAKDRDSAIGFNNLKLNTDEFFERLGSESEIIKVENGHLLHQHNRELVLNVSDSFDFINAKHGNTQGNESGFYLNSEEKFLPD